MKFSNLHEDPPVEGGYSGLTKRSCNLHSDCDEADKEAHDFGKAQAYHCNVEDCEDCFGW